MRSRVSLGRYPAGPLGINEIVRADLVAAQKAGTTWLGWVELHDGAV